ncbi:Transposase, Ptta/En/Spm, plant [Corchorus olitorius]|uniref:Transposase, Ptta/En/Spm, plant n=1 Tax=Corchorus olitorius TaxID=93759 RepID=A0A1R3KGI1_9ROSI|nr:Transposase, Ptta/En/Spm, plant [Corchorus olitorius]
MIVEEQRRLYERSPSLVNSNSRNEGFFTKKTRGTTRALRIQGVTKDNRIFIRLNTINQPIGSTDEVVNNLSTYLGTLARNAVMAPLVYHDWRKVPRSKKIDMLDLVYKVKRGSNEEISQADMYLLTHRNKEDTDRILLEYKHQLSRSLENSKDLDTQNGIFAQVMGIDKADHVYLYGRGVTSSVLKKKKISSLGSMNAQSVAENARKIAVDVTEDMKDKLQDEIQKKLEQHVQSIKAEPNDYQDIEHLVGNISLSQLCKMVEVNEFPGADSLI